MQPHGTEFRFVAAEKGAAPPAVLIVPLFAKPQPPLELVARVDRLCGDAVSNLLAAQSLGDKVGQLAHTAAAGACRRVLLVSLGDAARLESHHVRQAAAAAARWLVAEKTGVAALWIDTLTGTRIEQAVAEWALGMALAGFRFEAFRKPENGTPRTITVQLRAGDAGHVQRAFAAVKDSVTIAESVNYARALAHQPPNVCNPTTLAAEARRLARAARLKCTVLEPPQLRALQMHGLLAVGQGALHPARLIQLEYHGAPKARATTVLVGKAITFDTGGYSIKPAAGLEWLKFDKCGGAAVLGVLRAAAALKLHCNLVGLVAAAENAISERAYRPGDILTLMSGKTVEVNNTDAEGRLILADALTYAQQKLKPTTLIDLATLTGGVGVALGKVAAGLMSNDDALAADLGEAGRRTHERLWRLPLWDDYRELIKSTEADIKNSAGAGKRDAHAIVGGMFLKEFIADDLPWAHLDIAAVATDENGSAPGGKGATGFGVRLLIEFLRRRGA